MWGNGFWSGLGASALGGAAAGATASAMMGGDVGLGALSGLAGGTIGYLGGRVWPLGADAVAGGVSAEIMGGEFGDGALQGVINSSGQTLGGLLAPMEPLKNQDFQEGDVAYFKADSWVGYAISFFDGGPFSHVKMKVNSDSMVSATFQQVPGEERNGVGVWNIKDYQNRGARIISKFRGNQKVISAALAISKMPYTYGFLANQRVCSTTVGNAVSVGARMVWTGIGPNSQYRVFKSYGE